MDPLIFNGMCDTLPTFNPIVAQGVASHQLKSFPKYIEHVFRCAERSFPKGLKFVEIQRCTPYEEYCIVTDKRSSQNSLNAARSDVILHRILFTFEGKPTKPQYMYFPFAGEAGTMHVRGPLHTVSPVLADVCIQISANKNGIFIPFTRDKLTFTRLQHAFMTSDGMVDTHVTWSAVHAYARKNTSKTATCSTLAHYLFCKYGVTETFKKYAGVDVHIGSSLVIGNKYSTEDYVICRSMGLPPRRMRKNDPWIPSDVSIAVARKDFSQLVQYLLAGFYYVADRFPESVRWERVDDPRTWRILMGYVIFKSGSSVGKLITDVDVHLASLDAYVDDIVIESLEKSNIPAKNIYDLFAYIIENIGDTVKYSDPSDMYGKRLTVLRYISHDIIRAIFEMTYNLSSNNTRVLTIEEVNKILGKFLKRDTFLNGLSRGHGEVSIISAPGDSMVFKFTTNVVPQSSANGRRGNKAREQVDDPSKFLHVSVAEIGSYANLPKSDPTGRNKLNPCVETDEDGTVRRSEQYRALLDDIHEWIKR